MDLINTLIDVGGLGLADVLQYRLFIRMGNLLSKMCILLTNANKATTHFWGQGISNFLSFRLQMFSLPFLIARISNYSHRCSLPEHKKKVVTHNGAILQ